MRSRPVDREGLQERLAAPLRPSRRDVIVTALGSGFALAVRPVAAATITTGSDGLHAGEVKIPTPSGAIPAYAAQPAAASGKGPATDKKHPVVLVAHEIFGVHEHIKDVCRRLAHHGYFAVAPELFARQGDVSKLTDRAEIAKVVSRAPDAQVLSDLDAAVAWAKESGTADLGRLAITGFCWGGRIVWLYAAHSAAVRAGVAWYGRLVGQKDDLHPQFPIDVAAALKAPVLGLYGGQDQSIPVATVEEMRTALKAGSPAARASSIQVFPQAGHAFFADYRPSYHEESARAGWTQLLDWLKARGVA
jgi:carboxymethylenebutenolidase